MQSAVENVESESETDFMSRLHPNGISPEFSAKNRKGDRRAGVQEDANNAFTRSL